MRVSARRRELTFLAIAVVVLLATTVLFLAVRSSGKRVPKRGEAQSSTQAQTVPAGKGKQEKQARSRRDPFASRRQEDRHGAAPKPAVTLRLVGIVKTERGMPMAIIRAGEERYYPRVGERVAGYRVVSIGGDRVVLQGEGEQITLLLR